MTIDYITDLGFYEMKELPGYSWGDENIVGLANDNEALIDELLAEREDFETKISKIGQKIASGSVTPGAVDQLSIRSRALAVASMTCTAQINVIKRQEKAKRDARPPFERIDPKPVKKYNLVIWRDPTGTNEPRFWRRNDTHGIVSSPGGISNFDTVQQWTDTQIKKYGLESFERIEVQSDGKANNVSPS